MSIVGSFTGSVGSGGIILLIKSSNSLFSCGVNPLDAAVSFGLLATLNPNQAINPKRILQTRSYTHPTYTPASFSAQTQWHSINGKQHTHFAGAYWGYGFHEDGAASGLRAACAILQQTDIRLSQDTRLAKAQG